MKDLSNKNLVKEKKNSNNIKERNWVKGFKEVEDNLIYINVHKFQIR